MVIISKNEESLAGTLTALRTQCDGMDAECVVVDASNGRLGAVRDAQAWVRWYDFAAPAGRRVTIPHQRNLGVDLAKGEIIAFCDAGGIPADDWLPLLSSPIIDGDAVATAGPTVLNKRTVAAPD